MQQNATNKDVAVHSLALLVITAKDVMFSPMSIGWFGWLVGFVDCKFLGCFVSWLVCWLVSL